MLPIFLAGGAFVAAVTQSSTPEVDMYNHTLRGERVFAHEVVCRNRWGTPMLPDGRGGYSLISPINQSAIELSLIQPPKTGGDPAYGVPFRPATVIPAP